MNREARIRDWIHQHLTPIHVEVVNDSHRHRAGGAESHFRVVVVSSAFQGMSPLQRQRKIYSGLGSEMQANGSGSALHALSLQLYTPEEWSQSGTVKASPPCAGGTDKL